MEEWLGGPGHGRHITGATIEFGGGLDPNDRCDVAFLATDAEVTCWFLVGDETRGTARVAAAKPQRAA